MIFSSSAESSRGDQSGIVYLAGLALVGLGLPFIAYEIFQENSALCRWIPFIVFGLVVIGTCATATLLSSISVSLRKSKLANVSAYAALLTGIVCLVGFIFQRYGLLDLEKPSAFPALSVITVVSVVTGFIAAIQISKSKKAFALNAPLFIVFSILICATFFDFRNLGSIAADFHFRPIAEAFLIAFVPAIAFIAMTRTQIFKFDLPSKMQYTLDAIAIGVACALAVRSDGLFTPIAATNWEYYAGIVRTVWNGGTLLWDTPSQYGFLNILIASLLPVSSSWQAIYDLQCVLFLIVSVAVFVSIRRSFSRSTLGWLLAASCMLFVFFADPDLIGPQPYPSSSVLRFTPLYLFITFFLLLARDYEFRNRKRLPYILFSGIWITGTLWAAESAIYCTVTAAAGAIGWIFVKRTEGVPALQTLKRIVVPSVISFAAALIAVVLYVEISAHHFPDFKSFYISGMAFASGFAAAEISAAGPIWLLAIPLVLIGAVFLKQIRERPTDPSSILLLTIMGAVWAVFSYYVGRAVPDNLIAIIPLLTFAFVAVQAALSHRVKTLSSTLFTCFVSIFLSFGVLTTFAQTRTPYVLMNYDSLTLDAAERLPSAPDELARLLFLNGIGSQTPIVYHAQIPAPFPLRTNWSNEIFEKTWLPVPLGILEDPMPATRQREIFDRFLERNVRRGILVQTIGEFDDRLETIVSNLDSHYFHREIAKSEHFRILEFSARSSESKAN